MSHSPYRDYCNEELTSRKAGTKTKRLVISNPIPIKSSSSWSAIPYADGGSPSPGSRENISMVPYAEGSDENYNSQPTLERVGNNMASMQLSSPTDTVNTVIHSPLDRASTSSLTRRSVGNFEPLIRPEEPTSSPPADMHEDEIHAEKNSESQRLMEQHLHTTENASRGGRKTNTGTKLNRAPSRAASYDPGSCCYCLSNMTCANLFLWISMVVVLIGWSVSIWRSVDSLEFLSHVNIRTGYSMDGFPFTDITIIVISTATLLFSVVFLIISSYTSHTLSSYHLLSSQVNKCAYCFTIAMTVFSCIAVVLWTLIVAVTMIPTTAIIIIHLLFKSGSVDCVHLLSYGLENKNIEIGGAVDASLQLSCGDELSTWLTESWALMTPLLISLGCAILIEIILMGFIIVISSNGRHLYERMGYLMSSKIARNDSQNEQSQPFI